MTTLFLVFGLKIRDSKKVKLKPCQNSPMNFGIAETDLVAEFASVGNLETHESDGQKEIKSKPETVKLRPQIKCFAAQFTIL